MVSRSGRWWGSPRRLRWALGEEHPAARVDWAAGRRARELAVLGRRRDVVHGPRGLPRALASFRCLRRGSRGELVGSAPSVASVCRLRCASARVHSFLCTLQRLLVAWRSVRFRRRRRLCSLRSR